MKASTSNQGDVGEQSMLRCRVWLRLTFVCLGHDVYRAIFLGEAMSGWVAAAASRLRGVEQEFARVFAELDGEGVNLVQLFFRDGC